jgi:hypothetical protein
VQTESPAADIHQLVTDIADHNRAADLEQLWRLLATRELFAPVRQSNVNVASGTKHVVRPSDDVQLPIATLPNGMKFTPFFLEESDPRLGPHFVGLPAADAFRMVLKIPNINGLLLQSRTQSWVAVSREQIERILRDVLT